ncbi:hypothetical protein KY334_00270 [Candidatus Woesearchaeota archaeon]|nr:hypothetical protein [Candidatus Woesearchaeota archaeon]
MVNQKLVDYVQKYHAKGYDLQTLKNFLVKQGYPISEVNEAISTAYNPHTYNNKKFLIIISAAVVMIVSISAFLMLSFYLSDEDYSKIVISSFSEQKSIQKGQALNLKVFINNIGSTSDYSVDLSYDLKLSGFSEDSGSKVVSPDVGETTFSINPSKVGRYTVEVLATYEENIERTSYSFTVIPKCGDGDCDENEDCEEDCEVNLCNEICEDNDPCPSDCDFGVIDNTINDTPPVVRPPVVREDGCGNGVCESGESFITCSLDCEAPVCGNTVCEVSESYYNCEADCPLPSRSLQELTSEFQINKYVVDNLKSKSAAEIAKECSGLDNSNIKDACYNHLSKNTNSSYYCTLISNQEMKDNCYIDYAYSVNDYEVCNEVVDGRRKETCDTFRLQYELLKAYS